MSYYEKQFVITERDISKLLVKRNSSNFIKFRRNLKKMNYETGSQKDILSELDCLKQIAYDIEKSSRPLPHIEFSK